MAANSEATTVWKERLGLSRSAVKQMLSGLHPNATEQHNRLHIDFQRVLQQFIGVHGRELAAADTVVPGVKAGIEALKSPKEVRGLVEALAYLRTVLTNSTASIELRAFLLPTVVVLLALMTMLLSACAPGNNPLMVATLDVPAETTTPEASPTGEQLVDVTPAGTQVAPVTPEATATPEFSHKQILQELVSFPLDKDAKILAEQNFELARKMLEFLIKIESLELVFLRPLATATPDANPSTPENLSVNVEVKVVKDEDGYFSVILVLADPEGKLQPGTIIVDVFDASGPLPLYVTLGSARAQLGEIATSTDVIDYQIVAKSAGGAIVGTFKIRSRSWKTVESTATVTATATSTATPSETPTFTPEFTPTPSVPMAVPKSEINVRSGPGTNYDVATKAVKGQQLLILRKAVVGSETWFEVAAKNSGVIGYVRSDLVGTSGPIESIPLVPADELPPTPTRPPTATEPATPRPVDAQPSPTTQRPVETSPAGGGWLQEYFNKGAGPYEVEILEGGVGSHSRGKESFMIKKVKAAWARQRGDDHAIEVQFDDESFALVYLRGTPNTTTSSSKSPINGFCVQDDAKLVCILASNISAHGDIPSYVSKVAELLPGQIIGFNNTSGAGNSADASYVVIPQSLVPILEQL